MNSRVSQILAEIRHLEEELEDVINTQQVQLYYRIEGTKIRFEQSVRRAHQQLKTGIFRWLRESSPRNLITAPLIYALIVPFVLLDLSVTVYQWLCFPLYRIEKVQRNNYIILDRHKLGYLNVIEKFNCIYCGYATGLFTYTREIAARTEQYWCPIKHARKILDPHRRYARFSDFGDSDEFAEHFPKLRKELAPVSDQTTG